MYTTLPHDKINDQLSKLIKWCYNREGKIYICTSESKGFFSATEYKSYKSWTCSDLCSALSFLFDNIYVRFGENLYKQVVGIPMGTNCAPLVADLFLYTYEKEFIQNLQKQRKHDDVKCFISTSRYLDDILTIDNPVFEKYKDVIYPQELTLNKANFTDTETPFLDLNIKIVNGEIHTSVYDKRDDFGFNIVNFPWLDGDVPRLPSYGIYISQLIRTNHKGGIKMNIHLTSLQSVMSTSNEEEDYMSLEKKGTSSGETSPNWSEFENCFEKEFLRDHNMSKTAEKFLLEVFITLIKYIKGQSSRSSKVVDFHHPHQLQEIMAHCLDIDDKPRDLEQILSDCKETLKYCVKTGHPRFLNQLSTGIDVVGLAGEWLTAATNTNMFTFEVAPVFTLMEEVLIQKMINYVGWPEGEGMFSPGGAISNLYAVLMARQNRMPSTKLKGVYDLSPMKIFTSEQSHFSIRRAACLLGIGGDNVCYIPCDERGKMIPHQLEKTILETISSGAVPLMVNATCGTTVLGAYDNINDIADLCQRYNIWLHVDGAWGGSALLSRDHRHLLSGIERADSMTWNPHKMMGAPLQCSAFLIKHKDVLAASNEMKADYLFQKDKWYDVAYDTGDKSIQCGRHNDVFKLWLMWRAKGDDGFEEQINRSFSLSNQNNFQFQIEGPNVSFWFVTKEIEKLTDEAERNQQLNLLAPKLKAAMMEKGSMMVTYQPLGKLPNFFRIAISNQNLTASDLDFVMDEMERLGEDLGL
ncbi:hypothetical protein FSP39_013922 [Pinctada imbricata]|uniref:Reverse transcriptase domain-containing protein n=1 Tax=Pinctada imbricata TaxID=66713 RepID=A0AA89BNK3_PINIB|nr:hypothetical protein FSP39_013922 [Pinctada imbricata]